MKINQLSDAYASSGVTGPSGSGRSTGSVAAGDRKAAAGGPAQSAVVSISKSLSASAADNSGSPVNLEKVQAIRSEMLSGSYKVNPETIADNLLSSTADLLNLRRV